VRLAPGRWAVTAHRAGRGGGAEDGGLVWRCRPLALLGPVAVALAAWGERGRPPGNASARTAAGVGFLAPSALHLGVFSFAPMLFALYLSCTAGPSSTRAAVRRAANFGRMVHGSAVWVSLRNTVLYALYVPVSMMLCSGVALALNRQSWAVRAGADDLLPALHLLRGGHRARLASGCISPTSGDQPPSCRRCGWRPWIGWAARARRSLPVMMYRVWVQLGYQMTVFLAGRRECHRCTSMPPGSMGELRGSASAGSPFRYSASDAVRAGDGIIGSFQVFTLHLPAQPTAARCTPRTDRDTVFYQTGMGVLQVWLLERVCRCCCSSCCSA